VTLKATSSFWENIQSIWVNRQISNFVTPFHLRHLFLLGHRSAAFSEFSRRRRCRSICIFHIGLHLAMNFMIQPGVFGGIKGNFERGRSWNRNRNRNWSVSWLNHRNCFRWPRPTNIWPQNGYYGYVCPPAMINDNRWIERVSPISLLIACYLLLYIYIYVCMYMCIYGYPHPHPCFWRPSGR